MPTPAQPDPLFPAFTTVTLDPPIPAGSVTPPPTLTTTHPQVRTASWGYPLPRFPEPAIETDEIEADYLTRCTNIMQQAPSWFTVNQATARCQAYWDQENPPAGRAAPTNGEPARQRRRRDA